MSSDDESINNDPVVSDTEQSNAILEIGEELQDQEEQTEEVQRDETAEGAAGEDNEDGERKIVKPKRVGNPRPKLNAETLKGARGIAALESYFERVKFKGKGKEQQDLEVIMKTYEYWCHRLFPKFPFDTCIEKLETLGHKRAVQTHIKRIRFDLLVEDKPIIDDSDEEPNVEGFVDIQNAEINQQHNQQFDQLLGSSNPASVTTPADLTEEQLERIRINKERAEKLRQERLQKIRNRAEEGLQMSSQLPGTSGLGNETVLEPSDAIESTQSDIFSQENPQNDSYEVENAKASFDHESNVKGKTNVKGSKIQKKSSALNKKTAVFASDSEASSDDDKTEDNIHRKNVLSREFCDILDPDQNSSNSGFVQRKKRNKNIIDSDEDDDQIIEEENEKHKDSTSQSADDNSGDKNYSNGNISHKKLSKRSSFRAFMDTDESDQEMEQSNQPSKEINITRETNNHASDNSFSDQEMDTDQVALCDINKANSLSIGGLAKRSLDVNSSGQKSKSLLEIPGNT